MRRDYIDMTSTDAISNDADDDATTTTKTILCPFDDQIDKMRKYGISVEVREVMTQQQQQQNSIMMQDEKEIVTGAATVVREEEEDASPITVLRSYLLSEVNRNIITNETANDYLKAGTALLEELMTLSPSSSSSEDNGVTLSTSIVGPNGGRGTIELTLDSVTIQGFGSFMDKVTYPLRDRGLVLLRGTNRDGGGSD
eukprot:15344374-Ditylum_brightwellii.AAC.1